MLLPCVAYAVLVLRQQLQDSLLCLRAGVSVQQTFTLGDFYQMMVLCIQNVLTTPVALHGVGIYKVKVHTGDVAQSEYYRDCPPVMPLYVRA
jgi:hypothetical protein